MHASRNDPPWAPGSPTDATLQQAYRICLQDTLKILHTYKVFRPDIDGGIPFAIAALSRPAETVANTILVARRFGLGRSYVSDGVPVEAVASLGTVFSTPLAP